MKKGTRKPAVDTAVVAAVVAALQSAGLIPATAGNIKPASAKPATFTANLGSVTFTPDGKDGRSKGYTVVDGRKYYIRAYDAK
jgi:hypothetical protein